MSSAVIQTRLSGHETFVCRYAWLPKAVTEIESGNETLFKDENAAMLALGVGKNMVRSIRYWSEATQIIEPSKTGHILTDLGSKLLGAGGLDPYLERIETLWLLHWKIATNPLFPSHFWVQMLNYWHRADFSNSVAIPFLTDKLPNGAKCSSRTIADGFKVFVNTYVPTKGRKGVVAEDNLDSPFTDLGLLRETKGINESLYSFNIEDKTGVSSELFAYCLFEMWNHKYPSEPQLDAAQVSSSESSPGQVFKLPELAVSCRLEALELVTNGALVYVESAALQQIVKHEELNADTLLSAIYNK